VHFGLECSKLKDIIKKVENKKDYDELMIVAATKTILNKLKN